MNCFLFQIASEDNWICFMCSGESIRLLKRREDWQERFREFFLSDDEDEYVSLHFHYSSLNSTQCFSHIRMDNSTKDDRSDFMLSMIGTCPLAMFSVSISMA